MTKFVKGLARFMAILGGFVLTLLMLLTCVSILGRDQRSSAGRVFDLEFFGHPAGDHGGL